MHCFLGRSNRFFSPTVLWIVWIYTDVLLPWRTTFLLLYSSLVGIFGHSLVSFRFHLNKEMNTGYCHLRVWRIVYFSCSCRTYTHAGHLRQQEMNHQQLTAKVKDKATSNPIPYRTDSIRNSVILQIPKWVCFYGQKNCWESFQLQSSDVPRTFRIIAVAQQRRDRWPCFRTEQKWAALHLLDVSAFCPHDFIFFFFFFNRSLHFILPLRKWFPILICFIYKALYISIVMS